MKVALDHLFELIRRAFAETLLLEAQPCPGLRADHAMPNVSAWAHIHGAWNGAILLECARPLACAAAARMRGTDPREVSDLQMHAAVCELCRIIGCRLAAVLPGGCRVSPPTISEDQGWSSLRGYWPVEHMAFRCGRNTASLVIGEDISEPSILAAAA